MTYFDTDLVRQFGLFSKVKKIDLVRHPPPACLRGMEKWGYGRRRRPQFLSWWLTELIFITPISTSISRLTVTATNSFLKIKMISELSLRWFMNNGHDTAGSSNRHVVNTQENDRSAPSEERREPSQNWLSSTPDLVRQFSDFFDKLT